MWTGKWRNRAAVAGIGIVLTLALAGCGKSGSGGDAASPAAASASTSSAGAAGTAVVNVTASDFKWTLDKTEFTAGQPITFKLSGQDGAHGFSIVGQDVSQPIKTGETAEVTWTPDQPGTYAIKCNIMCGSGHRNMETTFTVK